VIRVVSDHWSSHAPTVLGVPFPPGPSWPARWSRWARWSSSTAA